MEWFSEVMDMREPVLVNTFGVSNQMFQVLPNRFFYEWKRAAVEGVLCPDGLVITQPLRQDHGQTMVDHVLTMVDHGP